MANFWENDQIVGQSDGGNFWEKDQIADDGWAEPGVLAPIQYRLGPDGKPVDWRWAAPQIVTETIKAIEAPGKALQGDYGLEVDPETYRASPITDEMIGDTMGTAGLGLTPLNPAAQAGARVAQGLVKPETAKVLARELGSANIPMSEIGARLSAMGPDAMVADLTPGLQARAAAIATMPGSGQKTIVDALAARRAASNARIQADVDATLGQAPTPSRLLAEVEANKGALSPAYRALFQGNELAVDTSNLALTLDSLAVNERGGAQAAARKVRDMLNVTGAPDQLDPNPETLLNTRHAIDGMMKTEADPNTIRILEMARKEVDNVLTASVPGIKEVDAQYAELARQGEAVGTGQKLLETGRTALRPDEVEDLFASSGLPQGMQIGPSAVPLRLSQGARAEIDRIIGTNVRDINAMKRIVAGDGNWNRDRQDEGPKR